MQPVIDFVLVFPVLLFVSEAVLPCLQTAHAASVALAAAQLLAWPSGLPDPNLQILNVDHLVSSNWLSGVQQYET